MEKSVSAIETDISKGCVFDLDNDDNRDILLHTYCFFKQLKEWHSGKYDKIPIENYYEIKNDILFQGIQLLYIELMSLYTKFLDVIDIITCIMNGLVGEPLVKLIAKNSLLSFEEHMKNVNQFQQIQFNFIVIFENIIHELMTQNIEWSEVKKASLLLLSAVIYKYQQKENSIVSNCIGIVVFLTQIQVGRENIEDREIHICYNLMQIFQELNYKEGIKYILEKTTKESEICFLNYILELFPKSATDLTSLLNDFVTFSVLSNPDCNQDDLEDLMLNSTMDLNLVEKIIDYIKAEEKEIKNKKNNNQITSQDWNGP